MCRSKSVETLYLTHFHSADDSIGCVLHKTKTNQEGSGPKVPRHLYGNTKSPVTCWVLALAIYLVSSSLMPSSNLFPSSNHKGRFAKALAVLLGDTTDKKSYGTHSIRKGVATFACSASTGGPSIVSVCLRCGWSLGGVQDRYFRYEAAGDQYLGRVVAGLPINNSSFAQLPPHFADRNSAAITAGVTAMYPSLAHDQRLRPILQLCLASLAQYAEFLSHRLRATHPLRASHIFCNTGHLRDLQVTLNTSSPSWMRGTGIPPHVELYRQQQVIQDALDKLPDILTARVSVLLDEKGVDGGRMSSHELLDTMRVLLEEAGLFRANADASSAAESRA